MFVADEAGGDTVTDFNSAGAGNNDQIVFEGYGTAAQGATFVQLNATQWQVTSADGLTVETITFSNSAAIAGADYVFSG